jgi:hypothetical protein
MPSEAHTPRFVMDRDTSEATHVRVFPSGARLEFRPSVYGAGWASRAVNSAGCPDNWIYFGRELPADAVALANEAAS